MSCAPYPNMIVTCLLLFHYVTCWVGAGHGPCCMIVARYDYLACGLGLGSLHVVRVWAVSHDGHDFLTHSIGKGLCHLMGSAWPWTIPYGHLACGL